MKMRARKKDTNLGSKSRTERRPARKVSRRKPPRTKKMR